jgi:hypothetical protein
MCIVCCAQMMLNKGMQRLKRNLNSYLLWDEAFASRIKPVLGDLGAPQLGLTDDEFEHLANNGCDLSQRRDGQFCLSVSRAQGVQRAWHAGDFAACKSDIKLKPVHFVSTLSILYSGGVNDGRIFREDVEFGSGRRAVRRLRPKQMGGGETGHAGGRARHSVCHLPPGFGFGT